MLIPKSSWKEQLFWSQGLNSAPKYTFQIQSSSQTCLQEISTSMHKRHCLPLGALFFLFHLLTYLFFGRVIFQKHTCDLPCVSSFFPFCFPHSPLSSLLHHPFFFFNSFSLSVLPITLSMKFKLLRFIFIERKFTKYKINHVKWTT